MSCIGATLRQTRLLAPLPIVDYKLQSRYPVSEGETSGAASVKKFGDRVRNLRRAKGLGQRALAKEVGISLTYVSKIENHRLDFGDYPS